MKKNLKLAVLLILVIFGCDEIESPQGLIEENKNVEELEGKANFLGEITEVDGVLKLPKGVTLMEAVMAVKKLSESEYLNWAEKFTGFVSMNLLFEKLIDLETEASDKMELEYKKCRVMPDRIHKNLPIHSKETLAYLYVLYIYPEGGLVPLVSYLRPGAELLVNSEGKIIIDGELVEFSNSKMNLAESTSNINASTDLDVYRYKIYLTDPYDERNMSTSGNYRTITDISYGILSRQGNYMEYSSAGVIVLRNFRKGFFGWNTRKTTKLKIEGKLVYEIRVCGSTLSEWDCENQYLCNSFGGHYYSDINLTSNGQSVKSLEFYFTEPTENNWEEALPVAPPNICYENSTYGLIKHELDITGENNNVSTFRNWNFTSNTPL